MLATHRDAEHRYEELRAMALAVAQSSAPQGVRLSAINFEALNAIKEWRKSAKRQVDWDWLEGYSAFQYRYPKRFEVALWQESELIALSLGRPTYHGDHLRLDFVEARPKDLGPRSPVFNEILVAYGIYARMINARQIRIMHPINEEVKDYYKSFGYQYVAKQDYLYKEVL
jgi:hypothetical protein